jgi:exonuclease SbcC
VLLTRLYLRNFRVYEDELDLALPPGLVGIFGPNGSGKSTLLEAILFTLWGRARTPKEQIRSAGVGSDCITEIEFEHEGHLYVVRRTLSGINATVRAEAHCDGLIMSEGVRDTGRYLHSVLGMDDAAFRASVFAEQKQLAAFSSQTPAERRRLVLQLLGITPLDGARDAARKDARTAADQHRHLREVLPDLDVLAVAADDASAAAGAAASTASDDERAAEAARKRAGEATEAFARLDRTRQEYDGLVIEGRAARAELDRAGAEVAELTTELEDLERAGAQLAAAVQASADLETDEEQAAELTAVLAALDAFTAVVVPAEPLEPDEEAQQARVDAAAEARETLAAIDGRLQATAAELARARDQAARSATLSGEGSCPVCGQALGDAFASVQEHRAVEVADAQRRLGALDAERAAADRSARDTAEAAVTGERALRLARADREQWSTAARRRQEAATLLATVLDRARTVVHDQPDVLAVLAGDLPGRPGLETARRAVATRVETGRAAAREADRLRGRLERRPALEDRLARAIERRGGATAAVETLRDKVRGLGFDREALAAAEAAHHEAETRAADAEQVARAAMVTAVEARTRAEAAAERLVEGRAQHGRLADLEGDVRHLSRVADLLAEFRNTVVASVGPRLALQAAELFGELTDHEYDELQVDPETYELQISDAGRSYGLDRFSGSEVDLANLALRVAISEHIRFQSGGSVGLLVLDEVFGPLDQDRKDRMLMALERLKGRFRQVLVVTHDPNVKEQMPAAIEVVKRPGRRATARVVA